MSTRSSRRAAQACQASTGSPARRPPLVRRPSGRGGSSRRSGHALRSTPERRSRAPAGVRDGEGDVAGLGRLAERGAAKNTLMLPRCARARDQVKFSTFAPTYTRAESRDRLRSWRGIHGRACFQHGHHAYRASGTGPSTGPDSRSAVPRAPRPIERANTDRDLGFSSVKHAVRERSEPPSCVLAIRSRREHRWPASRASHRARRSRACARALVGAHRRRRSSC